MVTVALSVSPAQTYEAEEPTVDLNTQPETREFGPFEYVQLTYAYLRVGPMPGNPGIEGEHIAIVNSDGFWESTGSLHGLPAGEKYTDIVIRKEA